MAIKFVILLTLLSLILIAPQARIQRNNRFPPQNSDLHWSSHSQKGVQHSTQEDTALNEPVPDETREEGIATPTPVSIANQQYILKAVLVMIILAIISSAATILIRRISNRRNSDGPENELMRSTRIQSADHGRPAYEPRPMGRATFSIEINMIKLSSNLL